MTVTQGDFPSMERLRWQCRRGMLELDVLLGRFLEKSFAELEPASKQLFLELLTESDQNLYGWLVGGAKTPREDYRMLLEMIRSSESEL